MSNTPTPGNVHVYGRQAALCFEPAVTSGETPTPTIAIDAALGLGNGRFDWSSKVRLRLTPGELATATAVFYGLVAHLELTGHGQRETGASFTDQGDKVFVKVWRQGEAARAVPVTPTDAYYVAALCLGQLRAGTPWLSGADVLNTLSRVLAARQRATEP